MAGTRPPTSAQSAHAVFPHLTTSIFALALAGVVWRHEMWRDELQAWALVRDARSIFEIAKNLRHEGHPLVWYIVLWLPSRVTRDPVVLKFVTVAVATATAWLVLRVAPFRPLVRVLLVFGYFCFYEYGVIARSYSIVLLLAVAAAALVNGARWRPGAMALVLALLANTHVYGVVLAGAFLVVALLRQDARRDPVGAVLLVAVVQAAVGVCMLTVRPPDNAVQYMAWRGGLDVPYLETLAGAPWRSVAPLPSEVDHFWGTTLLWPTAEAAFGVAVWTLTTYALRRSRAAVVLWLAATLGIAALSYFRALPLALRQQGIVWVILVCATWTAVARAIASGHRREALGPARIVAVTSLLGVAASVIAVTVDIRRPFSASEAAARWIDDNLAEPYELVCDLQALCGPVGVRLDKPIYTTRWAPPFTYWRFHDDRLTGVSLADRLVEVEQATGHPTFALMTRPPADSRLETVATIPPGVVEDEGYWLARRRQPPGAAGVG